MTTTEGEATLVARYTELQRELQGLEQALAAAAQAVINDQAPVTDLAAMRARHRDLQAEERDVVADLALLQQATEARKAKARVVAYHDALEAYRRLTTTTAIPAAEEMDRLVAALKVADAQVDAGLEITGLRQAARPFRGLLEWVGAGTFREFREEVLAACLREAGLLSVRTLQPHVATRPDPTRPDPHHGSYAAALRDFRDQEVRLAERRGPPAPETPALNREKTTRPRKPVVTAVTT